MISVKMEKSLKEAARQTATDLGIPLGTMINAFLRQLVRDKELNLSLSLTPTPYLRKVIAEGEKELKERKVPSAKSLEEFFAELDA